MFSLILTSNKSTPRIYRPISYVKLFSPRLSPQYQGEKIMPCRTPKSTGWYWNFLSSVFLHATPRATRWWLVWHVCHSHTFALNCFGYGVLFLPKAGLPRYSRFAAALNSHWQQTDATLRRCISLGRVKFRTVKSTVHVYLYSARCSKIWGSLATPILTNILTCRPSFIYTNN